LLILKRLRRYLGSPRTQANTKPLWMHTTKVYSRILRRLKLEQS
jgi:hypothetical protein